MTRFYKITVWQPGWKCPEAESTSGKLYTPNPPAYQMANSSREAWEQYCNLESTKNGVGKFSSSSF